MDAVTLFGGMMVLGVVFMLIIFILAVLIFVFWISMLIDCLKRNFKQGADKIVWVIVIIFTGIIGALIYYFIVRIKDKKRRK
jgi:phosphotransferase system  glucose/maltose/N-acetylglucosamine-specific IIC component